MRRQGWWWERTSGLLPWFFLLVLFKCFFLWLLDSGFIQVWWELMGPIGNAQAVLASGGRWGISGGQLSMAPRTHGLWGRPKEPAALLPSLAAGGELWFHRLMEPKIHPNGAVGAVSFQRWLLNLIRSTSIHVYFLWLGQQLTKISIAQSACASRSQDPTRSCCWDGEVLLVVVCPEYGRGPKPLLVNYLDLFRCIWIKGIRPKLFRGSGSSSHFSIFVCFFFF